MLVGLCVLLWLYWAVLCWSGWCVWVLFFFFFLLNTMLFEHSRRSRVYIQNAPVCAIKTPVCHRPGVVWEQAVFTSRLRSRLQSGSVSWRCPERCEVKETARPTETSPDVHGQVLTDLYEGQCCQMREGGFWCCFFFVFLRASLTSGAVLDVWRGQSGSAYSVLRLVEQSVLWRDLDTISG